RVGGIADGDEHVAQEARDADTLDRRAGEARTEAGIIEPGEFGEAGRREVGPRPQLHLMRRRGELVPGADREAVVAAVDAVAHGDPELMRDRALMLDIEVTEAAPRIELERRGEGVGRADVEAAG